MGEGVRILITGSRTWDDIVTIEEALHHHWLVLSQGERKLVTLVSGACPTGADRICEEQWERQGLPVERHAADWSAPCLFDCPKGHRRARGAGDYCPRAGFNRNELMVSLGADVCLAFIRGGSKGASHTAGLAEAAGIRTIRYTA